MKNSISQERALEKYAHVIKKQVLKESLRKNVKFNLVAKQVPQEIQKCWSKDSKLKKV